LKFRKGRKSWKRKRKIQTLIIIMSVTDKGIVMMGLNQLWKLRKRNMKMMKAATILNKERKTSK